MGLAPPNACAQFHRFRATLSLAPALLSRVRSGTDRAAGLRGRIATRFAPARLLLWADRRNFFSGIRRCNYAASEKLFDAGDRHAHNPGPAGAAFAIMERVNPT